MAEGEDEFAIEEENLKGISAMTEMWKSVEKRTGLPDRGSDTIKGWLNSHMLYEIFLIQYKEVYTSIYKEINQSNKCAAIHGKYCTWKIAIHGKYYIWKYHFGSFPLLLPRKPNGESST